jgi:hypothetical protein
MPHLGSRTPSSRLRFPAPGRPRPCRSSPAHSRMHALSSAPVRTLGLSVFCNEQLILSHTQASSRGTSCIQARRTPGHPLRNLSFASDGHYGHLALTFGALHIPEYFGYLSSMSLSDEKAFQVHPLARAAYCRPRR